MKLESIVTNFNAQVQDNNLIIHQHFIFQHQIVKYFEHNSLKDYGSCQCKTCASTHLFKSSDWKLPLMPFKDFDSALLIFWEWSARRIFWTFPFDITCTVQDSGTDLTKLVGTSTSLNFLQSTFRKTICSETEKVFSSKLIKIITQFFQKQEK